MATFNDDLTTLINKHSVENDSDTPDYILAQYIAWCLIGFNNATRARDNWHGFVPFPKQAIRGDHD